MIGVLLFADDGEATPDTDDDETTPDTDDDETTLDTDDDDDDRENTPPVAAVALRAILVERHRARVPSGHVEALLYTSPHPSLLF